MDKVDGTINRAEIYAGYATEAGIRAPASSGGIVSAILIDLIESGEIDGALVSRIVSIDGHIKGQTELATDRDSVLRCAGSSYIETPVLKEAARLGDKEGRFAVVALPCQVRALREYLSTRPGLKKRIRYIIGLFCRGTVNGSLYDDFFCKYGITTSEVTSVSVRRGHVSGEVIIDLTDGDSTTIPFAMLNSYRIAGIDLMPRCLWCDEHLAADADIAVGDIFTGEYRKKDIKHSAYVCWTEAGTFLMNKMVNKKTVTAEYFGTKRYRRSFSAIEAFSNRTGARVVAARFTGSRSEISLSGFFNIFHSLAWTIIFTNNRLSRTVQGRRLLFGFPPWIIRLEAIAVKALSRIFIGAAVEK
ncbi:MAG: Coenzyme F420 hydrogenase/dehydrogenase, beta subunit C-terminal domain [Candidatus Krumholzibacteriota bacterium]|nr:Coenzyme F420 hydrogenase/dehydrogenase, beta subunit C-terminal domain [Candidatus Krumholzibacteriota bacterium]